MLTYPNINPVAFQLGPITVHWYGLMYLLGFASAWLLANYRARRPQSGWTTDQVSDLIFYCAVGVLLGGRIGYMVFYDAPALIANPLNLFKVWQGGMSFHGGLLGVIFSVWLFARKTRKGFFVVGDFLAPLVPLGLAAGRMGNFINAELWGRATTMPWGLVYPKVDALPRHPSVLYEFLFEGIVLFLVVWIYSAKPRPVKAVSGLFLLGYGSFRFLIEFFRQPDNQLGFVAFHWLTMGQLLSIPMIIFGAALMMMAYKCWNGCELSGNT
ncbi:MAG: prolipoprotein diacylglyceryl transferase [Gammaproteobacteria bacterium]